MRSGCLVTLLWLAWAVPAQAKPPMWIIRDVDSEMVLFGSVHVLTPGLDWRPTALDTAVAQADDVWFEIPIDQKDDARIANLAAAKGLLSGTQSLFSMLSEEGKVRLNWACVKYGLAPGLIDRLQPWYAEVALASAAFSASGADAASGVEKLLSEQVPKRANRRAFETAEQQIEMFHGASPEAQLASLEVSLQELEHDPQGYDRLVTAWMASDVTTMDHDALAPLRLGAPEIYRRLVRERNSAWLSTLRGRLDGRGRTVVVVGVGHLIGPDGLPAQLRALGYSVEGP